jgi:putative membrane protein (TIGR04086 family)
MDKVVRNNTKWIFLLKGLLISYIITALILLLLSFFMLKLDLSSIVISGGINSSYILSAFMGGFFVGKKTEQKKFLWGLIMGVVYFLVLLLICIFMNQISPFKLESIFTVLAMCSLSGMLGGMVS